MRTFIFKSTAVAMATVCTFGLAACGTKTHEHSYIDEVIAPTCTDFGYTLHSCGCGYTF